MLGQVQPVDAGTFGTGILVLTGLVVIAGAVLKALVDFRALRSQGPAESAPVTKSQLDDALRPLAERLARIEGTTPVTPARLAEVLEPERSRLSRLEVRLEEVDKYAHSNAHELRTHVQTLANNQALLSQKVSESLQEAIGRLGSRMDRLERGVAKMGQLFGRGRCRPPESEGDDDDGQ